MSEERKFIQITTYISELYLRNPIAVVLIVFLIVLYFNKRTENKDVDSEKVTL